MPPWEIAAWPAWGVRLIAGYLQEQPAPEERIEIAVATLCALFFNANRGKDQQQRRLKDYLPFLDPWPLPSRYSDVDREVFAALGR